MDIIVARERFKQCRLQFRDIFGRELSDFWDVRTPLGLSLGFDITKFDNEVIKSGKKAMSAVVLKWWGHAGHELVKKLIGL
jgi:hypothetical protein